jgi:hypothetical protein
LLILAAPYSGNSFANRIKRLAQAGHVAMAEDAKAAAAHAAFGPVNFDVLGRQMRTSACAIGQPDLCITDCLSIFNSGLSI